jgi:hypothetical protein
MLFREGPWLPLGERKVCFRNNKVDGVSAAGNLTTRAAIADGLPMGGWLD